MGVGLFDCFIVFGWLRCVVGSWVFLIIGVGEVGFLSEFCIWMGEVFDVDILVNFFGVFRLGVWYGV